MRDLLNWARTSPMRTSLIHGERHWRCVAATGLVLAKNLPQVNPHFVVAFAIAHDSRRTEEFGDAAHGERAAEELSAERRLVGFLAQEEVDDLLVACRIHTGAKDAKTCSPNVQAALDADRLNLLRLGVTLEPERFSLEYSDFAFNKAQKIVRLILDDEPTWGSIEKYYKAIFDR